jgi:hypothetical protein
MHGANARQDPEFPTDCSFYRLPPTAYRPPPTAHRLRLPFIMGHHKHRVYVAPPGDNTRE